MPEGAARIYRFGPFVLDIGDRSLKRDGASVPLTPNMLPGAHFSAISRPRAAVNLSPSSKLKTPAMQAATYSPTL